MSHPTAIAFNKPYGVLSQFTPESGHLALNSFIQVPNLYPAGRLDHDSEGLLILSSDGSLAQRLTEPHFHLPKTYWAQVEGSPTQDAMDRMAAGLLIQKQWTKPAEARILDPQPEFEDRDPPIRVRQSIPTAWVELVLREGRNRQVRRMTAAVGLPTLRLVRVAVGPIRLEALAPGTWRPLTPEEVQGVWSATPKAPQARPHWD